MTLFKNNDSNIFIEFLNMCGLSNIWQQQEHVNKTIDKKFCNTKIEGPLYSITIGLIYPKAKYIELLN